MTPSCREGGHETTTTTTITREAVDEMKQFACGDVVPGCDAVFDGPTEDEILTSVAAHACAVHGLTEVPAELVTDVRSRIVTL